MPHSELSHIRAKQAVDFITTCCRTVGAFEGSSDVNIYLMKTAEEMQSAERSELFPDRYMEHVSFALKMVATNSFTSPPAAIASVYLATRFEYYFRILSGYLNADGSWKSSDSKQAVQSEIRDQRLRNNRISSVALAYKIMTVDHSLPFKQYCVSLDNNLYPSPIKMPNSKRVENIGDRIEWGRNVVGHGHWGDISSEALFYGLMTALVFYSNEQQCL